MTTSLSFRTGEKPHMVSDLAYAFMRRRQLYSFPLGPEDILYTQWDTPTANLIRTVEQVAAAALYWSKNANIRTTHNGQDTVVKLSCDVGLPISSTFHEIVATTETAAGRALAEWAARAREEQTKINWALKIIERVIKEATTHQQVHRYMPELYLLYESQAKAEGDGVTMPKHRQEQVQAITAELRKMGSSRAKRLGLEEFSLEERRELKTFITSTLILQPNTGLGRDSPFERTWVTWSNE